MRARIDFVVNVLISTRHVSDYHVGLTNLVENAVKYIARKSLLIDTLCVSIHIARGQLDSERVNIINVLARGIKTNMNGFGVVVSCRAAGRSDASGRVSGLGS